MQALLECKKKNYKASYKELWLGSTMTKILYTNCIFHTL
jgi:hypothetical protein